MNKYKKNLKWTSDLNSELITEHIIIDYIENDYLMKFSKVKMLLDIELDEEQIFTDNQKFIDVLINNIELKIEEYQNSNIKLKNVPQWLKNVDGRSNFGELISYVSDYLETEDSLNDINIFDIIKSDIIKTYKDMYCIDKIPYSDDEINRAILASKIIKNNNHYWENRSNEDILSVFCTTLKVLDYSSASNIYRQVFINVFSIFDAFVFDTLKEYFKSNINELEIFFNPNDSRKEILKLSFDDIIESNDIESIYFAMVEMRFSGKYLSNILKLLDKYKNGIFVDKISLCTLLEAVNRRNIHVHNKGIVDIKYLKDANPFSFVEGELAFITRDYLYNIFKILTSIGYKLEELGKGSL